MLAYYIGKATELYANYYLEMRLVHHLCSEWNLNVDSSPISYQLHKFYREFDIQWLTIKCLPKIHTLIFETNLTVNPSWTIVWHQILLLMVQWTWSWLFVYQLGLFSPFKAQCIRNWTIFPFETSHHQQCSSALLSCSTVRKYVSNCI